MMLSRQVEDPDSPDVSGRIGTLIETLDLSEGMVERAFQRPARPGALSLHTCSKPSTTSALSRCSWTTKTSARP